MAQLQFLELIISFCALVNNQCHVSKAAKHLGLSQPALSMQIKRLETKLNQKLFQRNSNQLFLTQEGERFYISVSGYAKTFAEFESIVSKKVNRSKKNISLKILGNHSAYHYILPKLSKKLFDRFPDLQLTIYFGETPQAISWLKDASIDIAILPRRTHLNFPEFCEYYPTFFYQPALITPKNHPLANKKNLTVEEISQYNLILPSPELIVIPNLYEIFPKKLQAKKLKIDFKNAESGRKFVEEGIAITISSDIIIEKNDPYLTATPLTHLFPKVDYGIVISKLRPLHPIWEDLKEICDTLLL